MHITCNLYTVLHLKGLNQTESPIFVILCVLCFKRQSFFTFIALNTPTGPYLCLYKILSKYFKPLSAQEFGSESYSVECTRKRTKQELSFLHVTLPLDLIYIPPVQFSFQIFNAARQLSHIEAAPYPTKTI